MNESIDQLFKNFFSNFGKNIISNTYFNELMNIDNIVNLLESIDSGDSLYFLGRLYDLGFNHVERDQQKSIEYFEKAVEKGNVYALSNLGQLKMDEELFDEAVVLFERAIEKENFIGASCLGFLAHSEDDLESAERYYRLAMDNDVLTGVLGLNDILMERGEKEDLAEALENLLKYQEHSDILNSLGYFYEEIQQDFDEAERYYRLAIEKDPENIPAYVNLATLIQHDDIKEAEELYQKAQKINPDDVTLNFSLACFYETCKKDIDQALAYYLKVDDFSSMTNVGLMYENQSDYLKAEKYYLLSLSSKNAEPSSAYINLALMYQKKIVNLQKAEEYFKLAIETDEKQNGDSEFQYGYFLETCNRFEEGKNYFLESVEKGNTTSLSHLAFYFDSIELDIEEADKYYRLSEMSGDFEGDLLCNYGLHLQNKGSLVLAESKYSKAVEMGYLGAYVQMAYYYEVREMFDKAEEYYILASDCEDPDFDADGALQYGHFLMTRDREAEAAEAYLKALQLGSEEAGQYLEIVEQTD